MFVRRIPIAYSKPRNNSNSVQYDSLFYSSSSTVDKEHNVERQRVIRLNDLLGLTSQGHPSTQDTKLIARFDGIKVRDQVEMNQRKFNSLLIKRTKL